MTDSKLLEPELAAVITKVFEEKVPFNRFLGLKIESLSSHNASMRIPMSESLVGNFTRGNLHGGVISTALDVIGGLTALLGVISKADDEAAIEEKLSNFSKLGTIDLRVDYLRPGYGDFFIASGSVLRTGNKVAVTRMEFHSHQQELIALGTGTYIVG